MFGDASGNLYISQAPEFEIIQKIKAHEKVKKLNKINFDFFKLLKANRIGSILTGWHPFSQC